jgi:tripartite-type tricarboxylate transporter receptor subunit TctC
LIIFQEGQTMLHVIRGIAVLLLFAAGHAVAQKYPDRPVRMLIGFTPGTATDIIARVLGQKVGDSWGQNVVAENRPGAGSTIAAGIVAKAVPDGYTLLFNSSAQAVNPGLYAKLPYDTLKDFTAIAPVAAQPNVLVVGIGSPIKTVAELIAAAKAKPGQLNFGSAGTGTGTHLNLEKFKLMAGVDLSHIPYKGTPEVATDIIGGRIEGYFAPITAALPFVNGGKLRAVAVSTAKRSNQLPNVPTIAEAGVAGFDFALWFGVWGPAGMAPKLVDQLSKDFGRALAAPDVREQLAKLGSEPLSMTPAEFDKFVRKEIEDYSRVLKAAGIKPQ